MFTGNKEKRFLEMGDTILLEKGHKVYSQVPKHFLYSNHIGNWETCVDKVVLGERSSLRYLMGEYVVTHIEMTGGSPPYSHDPYPDGHRVYCEKIMLGRNAPIYVNFYQSGAFTAMILPGEISIGPKVRMTYERE